MYYPVINSVSGSKDKTSCVIDPRNMAELSDVKPVVYVSPIWKKQRRIKSFKQAVIIVVKLIRLNAYTKPSKLTIEMMREQLKKLANEDQVKEERLQKVKCLAKLKKGIEIRGCEEWRKQYLKIYRQKFQQVTMLEKMKQYSQNHWISKKSTNNAVYLSTLRNSDVENRKLESPAPCRRPPSLINITNYEHKAFTPTPNLVHDCEMKRSIATTGIGNKRTTEVHKFEKGRLEQSYLSSNALPKDIESKRPSSSTDGTSDPRFQNLLRSLTPIDC